MEKSFSELLTLIRQRKPGLTQERIAHQMGYDAALIARMIAGKKDLTGPSGRNRVLILICVFIDEGVLFTIEEANDLLLSGGLHPLHPAIACDSAILERLQQLPSAFTILAV